MVLLLVLAGRANQGELQFAAGEEVLGALLAPALDSAVRRVSRPAITMASTGQTCVNTPILNILRLPRNRPVRRAAEPAPPSGKTPINDPETLPPPWTRVPRRLLAEGIQGCRKVLLRLRPG